MLYCFSILFASLVLVVVSCAVLVRGWVDDPFFLHLEKCYSSAEAMSKMASAP
jgi:hypothetical protein